MIPNYYKQKGDTINMTQYFRNRNKINDATKVLLQPQILLIPRKQIGGQIPKFQNAGKLKLKNYNSYTLRSTPGQDFINSVSKKGIYTIGHSYTKNNTNYGLNTTYIAKRDLKMGNNSIKKGLHFRVRQINNDYVLDVFDNTKIDKTRENKGPEQYKGNSPETAIVSLVKDKPKTSAQQALTPSVNTQRPTTQRLAPRTRNNSSSFSQAFKEARSNGLETFNWNGRLFNTRLNNESVDDWKKNLKPTIETPTVETPTVEQLVELTPELNAPINRYKTYDGIVGAAMNGNTYSTNTTPYSEWYKRSGNIERYLSDLVKNLIEKKYKGTYDLNDFNNVLYQ